MNPSPNRLTCPIILAAFAFIFLVGPAHSQWAFAKPPPSEADRGEPSSEEEARVQERVRMMRMYALTEALELDEETATKLFPYLRKGDQKLHELHGERRRHKKALHTMMKNEAVNEKALDEHFEALVGLDLAITETKAEQARGLKKMLSPQQRLRFLLVQERFQRRIREMLRDERRKRRGDGAKEHEGRGRRGP